MIWNKTHKYLREQGYDVYAESQHMGLCKAMYLVLYEGETEGQNGVHVGQTMLDVMVVVPQNQRSNMGHEIKELKRHLKGLDFIQPTGFVSGTITQVEKKAYSKVVGYVINRRL